MAHRLFLIGILMLLFGPAVAAAQSDSPEDGEAIQVRVVTQENFRQTPGGKQLAIVREGARLVATGRQGDWREVTLSGWAPSASLGSTGRGVHDLVVTTPGGENLRAEPSGDARVAAEMLRGFLLAGVGESGDWTRVRRTGWMWEGSLEEVETPEDASPADGSSGPGARAAPAESAPERLVVGENPVRLFISPEGDTVGRARPGSEMTVLDRQDDWTRVRMEVWVRSSEVESVDPEEGADLTIADLRANPGQFDGRRVRWELQFISLERAEPARTDFYEGEPFILARSSSSDEGFVYLAVPPELVSRVEGLDPLQVIRVGARVRTGRSALMGAPILDLLELR